MHLLLVAPVYGQATLNAPAHPVCSSHTEFGLQTIVIDSPVLCSVLFAWNGTLSSVFLSTQQTLNRLSDLYLDDSFFVKLFFVPLDN